MSDWQTFRTLLLRCAWALIIATTVGLIFPILLALFEQINEAAGCHGPNGECQEGEAEERIAVFTLWLAAFTAVLGGATFGLYVATRTAITDARLHSERELRAYVNIGSVRVSFRKLDEGRWMAFTRVEICNFGQTPAKSVRIFGEAHVLDWPISDDLVSKINDRDPRASRFVLGPTATRPKIEEREFLGHSDIAVFGGGWDNPASKAIVAYGKIHYVDSFGKERTTEYCYFAGGSAGLRDAREDEATGEWGRETYRMVAHSSGNDAT